MVKRQRGFASLVLLLLIAALIAWLAVTLLGRTAGTGGTGGLDQYRSAIDRAEGAKALIEARSAQN